MCRFVLGRHGYRFGAWASIAVLLVLVIGLSSFPAHASDTEDFAKRFELPRDPHPAIKEILSRPEFTEDYPASLLEELQAVLFELVRRALRWLSKHFPKLPRVDVDPAPAWWLVEFILIAALLVAVVVVGWIAVKYALSGRRRRPTKSPESFPEEAEFIGSEEALAAARAMAAGSRFREALIYLFRFVLLRLDERGTVTLRPGKTNREILRSVPEEQPIRQPLAQMILLFNRVRYGNEACSRTVFERFVSLSRRVTGGA